MISRNKQKAIYYKITTAILQAVKNKLKAHSIYLAIGFILLLIISLARNITKIRQAQEKIQEKKEEVEKLEERNKKLKEQFEKVSSEEFAERELRDKLGLAKEGEIIIVLPDEATLRKLIPELKEEEEVLPDPNWKKWLKLFLN
jgi:cell division protein FtsB